MLKINMSQLLKSEKQILAAIGESGTNNGTEINVKQSRFDRAAHRLEERGILSIDGGGDYCLLVSLTPAGEAWLLSQPEGCLGEFDTSPLGFND